MDIKVPDRNLMYTAQVLTQQLYPEFITSMRELAGGGLIMLPSSAEDFANPELNKYINATSKKSAIGSSEEKSKIHEISMGLYCLEFASRHTQYEMFYAGANLLLEVTHFERTIGNVLLNYSTLF